MKKHRWLAAALVTALAVRALLPLAAEAAIEKGLRSLDGYSGSVKDVDLALIRGRVEVEGLRAWSTEPKQSFLVEVDRAELALLWGPLFRGRFVFSLSVEKPAVWLRGGESPPAKKEGGPPDAGGRGSWMGGMQKLLPVKLERMAVRNGAVTVAVEGMEEPFRVEDISVDAANLTNNRALSDGLYAEAKGSARAVGGGDLSFALKADPLARSPAVDMDFELKSLELTRFNGIFRRHARLDVRKGAFSMAGEARVKDGKIDGYVRPALEDVEVFAWKQDVKEDKDSVQRLLWEGAVEVVKKVFESDRPREQVATRIPLQGSVKEPETDVAAIAWNVLRNAFWEAILPLLEHSIRL